MVVTAAVAIVSGPVVATSISDAAKAAKPGPPTAVNAMAGDASATISWSPPLSDGGSPITGYTVTSSTGPGCSTTGATSCTVNGLANAVAVSFTVTATNVAGTSKASAPSASIMPASSQTSATYTMAAPFNPATAAVNGSTDVYHCFLIDPHLTTDSYVTASQVVPDQIAEFHHAILFLVNPNQVSTAQSLNAHYGGNGWPCFGTPLNPSGSFDGTPWIGGWSPGRGPNVSPAGTGVPMPAGSMIALQVHYNLLSGSTSDQSSVILTTTPQVGSGLKALSLDPLVAPPDLPCPKNITGALCSRSASLADLGTRFGQSAVTFVNGLEFICGHDWGALKPSTGTVSTTCTYPVGRNEVIRVVTPHMHMLGQTEKVQLLQGSKASSLVNVAHYSFDGQISYPVNKPIAAHVGDQIKLTCSFDPRLRQELPILRSLPARYVTWGDGSTDERCLVLIGSTQN